MSLDVYLESPTLVPTTPGDRIFIRENGQMLEVSMEEWRARYPDREPVVVQNNTESHDVFSANITHNLNKMASEAGVYQALWRPEELGIVYAGDLIILLEQGLSTLQADPPRFQAFNPSNGWGSYGTLVDFVQRYLDACKEYPTAKVRVWV